MIAFPLYMELTGPSERILKRAFPPMMVILGTSTRSVNVSTVGPKLRHIRASSHQLCIVEALQIR